MFKWFEYTFGFKEYGADDDDYITRSNYESTQREFTVTHDDNGCVLISSRRNGRTFVAGEFSVPSVARLRSFVDNMCSSTSMTCGELTYSHEAILDVFALHSKHPNATFQAASQFNCLEFASPGVTPECGISGYAFDATQGPACALACPAGTLYRNYFAVPPGRACGEVGQTDDCQINTLHELEKLLDNSRHKYFCIRNGYTCATEESLNRLNIELERWQVSGRRDELVASVKVGVQAGVAVEFARRFERIPDSNLPVLVNQVYCSALSCGYTDVYDGELWRPFAQIIQDACYEATLLAAMELSDRRRSPFSSPLLGEKEDDQSKSEGAGTGREDTRIVASTGKTVLGNNSSSERHKVFLTLIGGGVFRNDPTWIARGIGRALAIASLRGANLDVKICYYRRVTDQLKAMIDEAYEREMNARRPHPAAQVTATAASL